MITLNDLKLKAQKNIPNLNDNIIILYANNDTDIAEASVSLFEIFDEDDNQLMVMLISQGEEIGYIKQEDIYSFVKAIIKDIDSFANFDITGKTRFKEKYRCPKAYQYCDQYYWIIGGMHNVGSSLPKCKKHDNIDMIKER